MRRLLGRSLVSGCGWQPSRAGICGVAPIRPHGCYDVGHLKALRQNLSRGLLGVSGSRAGAYARQEAQGDAAALESCQAVSRRPRDAGLLSPNLGFSSTIRLRRVTSARSPICPLPSMIQTPLAITEPDAQAWDAFVLAHPYGSALQSAGWAALKGAFGWSPRIVGVATHAGLCAGAMLLIRRRAGLGAVYIPRGPLFSGNPMVDAALLAAVERIARSVRAVFLRIEPNLLEDSDGAWQLHSDLQLQRFQPVAPIQPRSSIHLDLTPDPERLLALMSKGHRADIRRAGRDGVVVESGASAAQFQSFYAILEQTSQRNQFGIHAPAYYQAVLSNFGDAAQIWIAGRAGVAEATALTLAWGATALYLYSGSSEAGLRSGAQHAIQWEVIRWARERGCSSYDFWGVPDAFGVAAQEPEQAERSRLEEQAKHDALYGVYRFKKGFGGRVVRYLPAYDRVLMPPLYALWRRVAE